MNRIIQSCLFLALCVATVSSYCYMYQGCKDDKTHHDDGDTWFPSGEPCVGCYCDGVAKYVLRCGDVETPASTINVKKSSLSAATTGPATTTPQTSIEEIEISESEADTIKCPPERGQTFNWLTGGIEEVNTKTVIYYYYIEKITHCCSTNFEYRNVHPDCKVVRIGECSSKAVMADDESQPCMMEMSMVG